MEKLFCMRLNTAGVVIGWLGIVGSIAVAGLCAKDLGPIDDEAQMILIVLLAITAINIMASGLLVLGTMKERHLMLLPWLIYCGILLVLSCIYQFMAVVTFILTSFPLLGLICSFLIFGLEVYIYRGIYSLYKEIKLTSETQLPFVIQSEAAAGPNQGNSYASYTKV